MNTIKTLFMIAIMITLLSCDHRDPNIPELAVSIYKDNEMINTLYTNTESNFANIHIKLTGEYEEAYAIKKIDMEYDHSKLNIVIGGDASFFYTDSNGNANGFITALNSGNSIGIRFSLSDYNNVRITKYLTVYNPTISYMTANPTVAIANGNAGSVITVRITPSLEGKQITLDTTLGELHPETATTNVNGEITSVLTSLETGSATITANWTIPNINVEPQSVTVNFTQP